MADEQKVLEQQAALLNEDTYATGVRLDRENLKRCFEGKVVVKKSERPLQKTRQGWLRYYLHNLVHHDTVLKDWRIFVHEIYTHTGKHNHQGAMGLFVLDGEGYTIVDGERVDWKKGDLILLPVKPGGVDHQHFNRDPQKPARWLALSYRPFKEAMAQFIEQKEDAPGYQSAK